MSQQEQKPQWFWCNKHGDFAVRPICPECEHLGQAFTSSVTPAPPEASHRAIREWQPIETAPQMRTLLLFAVSDIADDGTVRNWKMATGSYHTGYEDDLGASPWYWDGHQLRVYELHPTHWMPLPDPPAALSTGTETQET
jgi:hypothetical protein